MKRLIDVDLTATAQILAVANTPFFLLRKLRAATVPLEISELFSDAEILSGLEDALKGDPNEPVSAARPYVYAMALFRKPDSNGLRAAAALPAERWKWYSRVVSALLEAYSPISLQTFRPVRATLPSPTSTSIVPASKILIEP